MVMSRLIAQTQPSGSGSLGTTVSARAHELALTFYQTQNTAVSNNPLRRNIGKEEGRKEENTPRPFYRQQLSCVYRIPTEG